MPRLQVFWAANFSVNGCIQNSMLILILSFEETVFQLLNLKLTIFFSLFLNVEDLHWRFMLSAPSKCSRKCLDKTFHHLGIIREKSYSFLFSPKVILYLNFTKFTNDILTAKWVPSIVYVKLQTGVVSSIV